MRHSSRFSLAWPLVLNRSVFITGTDTGVGKTFCACMIAAAARRRGLRVGVFKPVETGWKEESSSLHDTDLLKHASGTRLPTDLICPYRFPDPLAPLTAAERATCRISIERIKQAHREVAEKSDIVIAEGAGGLMVPLTPQASFADLVTALDLPLLIVAGSRLGAVNHTLLTIEVARQKGIHILGYVLNQPWPGSSDAVQTNRRTIGQLTDLPCLGEVPHMDPAPDPAAEPDLLAAMAEKHLDLSWLRAR